MRRSQLVTLSILVLLLASGIPGGARAEVKDPIPPVISPGSVEATGGPDPFGYTYIDSNEPDGPVFLWNDISGTGTDMGLSDDSHFYPIALPFDFEFYGVNYNQIAVGSNGTVYFEDAYLGLSNTCIPSTTSYVPQTFIAGYWDDLDPTSGGAVYYEIVGSAPIRELIVQWENVPHFGSSDTVTYQVILYEGTNNIRAQYDDPSSEMGAGSTEGIQADPSLGLEYACDSAVLTTGLAICYVHPDSTDPNCGGGSSVPYDEPFDMDLGTTTASNDGSTSNEWHFRDDCPANLLGGHSGPGAARWGNPASCSDYGTAGSIDLLQTPVIDVSSCDPVELSFNYFLDYQEDSTWDRASVELIVDGGPPVVVADNGAVTGGLAGDASWHSLAIDMTPYAGASTLQVVFVGDTSDGIGNSGEGFFVDDLLLECALADCLASDQLSGLFGIDLGTGLTAPIGPMPPGLATEIEYDPLSGILWAEGTDGNPDLWPLDPLTGVPLGPPVTHAGGALNGLEVVGSTLYGTFIPGPLAPSDLVIVDTITGALTPVGPTGFGPISGLAFDPFTGTMYGVTAGGAPADLVTIDLATGAATPVGPTGLDRIGSIEFGPDGLLYAGTTGSSTTPVFLFWIDTTTGAAVPIGPTGVSMTGLTCTFGPPLADLAITKDDGSTTAIPGTPVTYTIDVANLTMTSAEDYSVTTTPYFFEDISGTGTPVALFDDEVSPAIPLGFTFDYYGIDYTDVYISSNGFLTVLPGQPSGCCTGLPIPSPTSPNGTIAGWWEDLDPPEGIGAIYYETLGVPPNQRHIVQFSDVEHFPSGTPVTFQFKLFEGSDVIEVHYAAAPSDGGAHSAGIENETGTVGVRYFLGASSLPTPLAVRYAPSAPADVVGALVEDVFSPDLTCTWTCVATPGSACTAGPVAGDISDLVDLLEGGLLTYTAVCDIDPFAVGVLSNTATVAPPLGWIDIDPLNNGATDDDNLVPTADLAVVKTDSPDPVFAGDDLTYTVTITNLGPSGVVVAQGTDALPGEVVPIQTSGCVEDPLGVPVCTVGMIPPGGAKVYTILTAVQAGLDGVIVNDVTASGSAFDPNPGNNTWTESTTVIGDADLALTKSDDFDPRMAGKTQTYRLAVTNNGPAAAAGVTLEEVLPAETYFVSIEPAAPTCTEAGGIITCGLPNLASGESFEVRFDLWIDKELEGVMANAGSVSHQQTDPVPGNNDDTELTEVVSFRDLVGLPSVNQNASSDVAVLETGSLKFSVIDGSTGTVISGDTFQPEYKPVAMTWIPNFQETSAPELIILARKPATGGGAIFIRDARSGAPIRLWGLSPEYRPIQVTAIPSFGGSTSWEVAVLTLRYTDDRPRVFVLDAKEGTLLSQFNFPIPFFPLAFGSVPSFGGGAADELVVTGRKATNRAVAAIFKDAASGATVSSWFNTHTVLPIAAARVSDWDGSGDRLAILGRRGPDGATRIFIREVATGVLSNVYGSPTAWLPIDLEVAADFGGPPADETVILRWKPTDGDTRITAKDASDGSFLAGSLTDPDFLPLDLELLPDWLASPAEEGAILGIRLVDGQVRVFLKDAGNGADLGFVDVP